MFKLLLTICFVALMLAVPNMAENTAFLSDGEEPGFISSISDLWGILMRAKNIGSEELEKVLNDPRVDEFLGSLNVFLRKAALTVVEFFKKQLAKLRDDEAAAFMEKNNIETNQVFAGELSTLQDIFYTLTEAAKGGAETLLRVINDPEIREKINNLGWFARVQAEKLLNYFEGLLKSNEQASKFRSADSVDPLFIDFNFDISSLKFIYEALREAAYNGYESLVHFIDSLEFKRKLEELPAYIKSVVQDYVNWIKKQIQPKIESKVSDDVLVDMPAVPVSLSEDILEYYQQIKTLVKESAAKGKLELLEFLQSEKLQELLSKLPSFFRPAVQSWVDGMIKALNIDMEDIKAAYEEIKAKVEEAAANGKDKLNELIQSEHFQKIFVKFPASVKTQVSEWINNLKEKIE